MCVSFLDGLIVLIVRFGASVLVLSAHSAYSLSYEIAFLNHYILINTVDWLSRKFVFSIMDLSSVQDRKCWHPGLLLQLSLVMKA
jgi:hypothetical protein